MTEHVGADHDATLHFRAETFAATLLVELFERLHAFRAMAVAHTVEAREIGAGLGRRDDVVRRHRQRRIRQRDLADDRAESLKRLDCRFDLDARPGRPTFGAIFLRPAHLPPRSRTTK